MLHFEVVCTTLSQSQLRTKLAMELQNSFGAVSPRPAAAESGAESKPNAATRKTHRAMSVQVANSIIAEHMKIVGFEYSLSVFLPEAGLTMDKVKQTILCYPLEILIYMKNCIYSFPAAVHNG